MKKLEDYTDEEIERLKLDEPKMDGLILTSKINDCELTGPCVPIDFFEKIEQCKLCGKLF